MNLNEYQKAHGIKRIDFSKVKRSGKNPTYAENILVCPYCDGNIEYDSYDEEEILSGTTYECPHCGKQFYAEGEVTTISTTCKPIEDVIMDRQKHIEANYRDMDDCDAKGMDFYENQRASRELHMYNEYGRPFFENAAIDIEVD